MGLLYPFHPRLVHFPIALSLVGVLFIALGFLRAREQWVSYGRLSILLGWLGAIVAALTGLIDQSSAPATPVVVDAINAHITAGIALIVVFGLALYWPLRTKRLFDLRDRRLATQRYLYLALLLLGVILVIAESWLGGQLVFTLGVGVR